MHLVLYDDMEGYGEALCTYLSSRQIKVARFRNEDSLLDYLRSQNVDVLLVAEHLYSDRWESLCKAAVCLCEEDTVSGVLSVKRYQAADELLQQIYLQSGLLTHEGSAQSARLISIYSPSQDPKQSEFAWELAKAWSEADAVLYVNLTENAGLADRLGREFQWDLSDLIYLDLRDEGDFEARFAATICIEESLAYIPPPENGCDILALSESIWIDFFNKLIRNGQYRVIICEFGCMIPGFFEIMAQSSLVYLPVLQGPYQTVRNLHFAQTMKKRDSHLSGVVQEITLPQEEGGICRMVHQLIGGMDG